MGYTKIEDNKKMMFNWRLGWGQDFYILISAVTLPELFKVWFPEKLTTLNCNWGSGSLQHKPPCTEIYPWGEKRGKISISRNI